MQNLPSDGLNISTTQGQSHNGMQLNGDNTIECDSDMGVVPATITCALNKHQVNRKAQVGAQNIATHVLNQAMKKWRDGASNAALKEMKQLLDCKCFVPMHADAISDDERKHVMQLLLFLAEKHDGTIKARHCANGSMQWNWTSSESTASPTAHTESVPLSAVIDAQEGRDVAVSNVPNAFIQTEVNKKAEEGHRMIMKIRGVLIDVPCNMDLQSAR